MICSILSAELKRIYQLQSDPASTEATVDEDKKSQIAEIFNRVNDARMRFEVCSILSAHMLCLTHSFQLGTSIRLYSMVYAIGEKLKVSVADD
jgi:hypothetical protein